MSGTTAGLAVRDRVVEQLAADRDELVELAAELIRVPTVNPPGRDYRPCAELIGDRLGRWGFEVDYPVATDHPDHSEECPRVNVVGLRRGASSRPLVHLNGHIDVVPVGDGWTVDPFAGLVRDGKLYGRGSADMKAGLAAAMMAAESLRRVGVELSGSIEISGTADEESGGFAGVAHLAEIGRISSERVDHVIIPEPLGVDRICIGHRGVYWFDIVAHGRIGHGSMPYLGASAIDAMAALLERIRTELGPRIAERVTAMPCEPPGSRHASINVNAVMGGQAGEEPQTPCVADRCVATFDRRFLLEEDLDEIYSSLDELMAEVAALDDGWSFERRDRMLVEPVQTPQSSALIGALGRGIEELFGHSARCIASPGTYDHKHVTRIGGIDSCVAYGPGELEQAHQPDEWCRVEDMVRSAQVMALALIDLVGVDDRS